jgi:hypothetical protein
MKFRAVVILVGLAISFALPIFAQEKEDVKPFPFTPIPAGPQLVEQIEAINQKFDEAFNKHDAAAVSALYTSNAAYAGCPCLLLLTSSCESNIGLVRSRRCAGGTYFDEIKQSYAGQ